MRDIEALLTAGNKAQREKLEKYNYKPSFENISFVDSFNGLVDEVKELAEAFQSPDVNKQGYKNIRHEAADVANFAHMIILACDKEISKPKGDKN